MELNIIPDTASVRVLHEAELDIAVGGLVASQVWVSPMAIHGFNPQPDPPAFGNPLMTGPAAHA